MTGLTKDAGWQLGVRRTTTAPLDVVWGHLVDADGPTLAITAGGEVVEVRTRTERRRIRLRWRESGAEHDTTLQITVLPAARGTTIALHQEHLSGPQERERLLEHWTVVVEGLVADLDSRVEAALGEG